MGEFEQCSNVRGDGVSREEKVVTAVNVTTGRTPYQKLEDDIAFLTGEIVDLRRQINRLRKAPAIYTTYPEYDREEPTGS